MAYIDQAPPALIHLYERKSPGGSLYVQAHRPLLGKLLCDKRMTLSWKTVRKYMKNDQDYEKLWENIIYAMADAKSGSVRPTDKRKLRDITKARRKVYEDITKSAQELSALIAAPQCMPADGSTQLYKGELDRLAYEFLPEDVAHRLGAESFTQMSSSQRHTWASSILNPWPTMVELLDQLAKRAKQLESKTVPMVKRDRGHAYWVIFVRRLYGYLCDVDRRFGSIGFGPIKAITNATMTVIWERQRQVDICNGIGPTAKPRPFTAKKVRTIVCGASGRKPTH